MQAERRSWASSSEGELFEPALTSTPLQRRQSNNGSDNSIINCKTVLFSCANDSGNYSATDLADAEQELQHSSVRYQQLREKEVALFLALQDVRKLRSELERLSKSEQWYKQELKAQKSTRLEALQRLYAQERNYMQENQRLQGECVRLYAKCGEMELELEGQRVKAMQELSRDSVNSSKKERGLHTTIEEFEIEQQQALINDQQQLIVVLRKQKRGLLEDLKRLTEEKDEKVLELQRMLATIEVDNTRMTARCKQLLDERNKLEDSLKLKDTSLNAENTEKRKLHKLITDLREQLDAQEQLLATKERKIIELQNQFNLNLKQESNVDEIHRLCLTYHSETNAKTAEITSLKHSLVQLQGELESLGEIQIQNEAKNFHMDTRLCELDSLKQNHVPKTENINELRQRLEQLHSEKETALERLVATEANLINVENDLVSLNEQYASVCALCERTKFELEMREIEQKKLKFREQSDQVEIEQLREKLKEYLQQTAKLSERINVLEAELEHIKHEKRDMEAQLVEVEHSLCAERERCKKTESMILESDEDLKELQSNLKDREEYVAKLREENKCLKEKLEQKSKRPSSEGSQEVELVSNANDSMQDYELEIEKLQVLLAGYKETIAQLKVENKKLTNLERTEEGVESGLVILGDSDMESVRHSANSEQQNYSKEELEPKEISNLWEANEREFRRKKLVLPPTADVVDFPQNLSFVEKGERHQSALQTESRVALLPYSTYFEDLHQSLDFGKLFENLNTQNELLTEEKELLKSYDAVTSETVLQECLPTDEYCQQLKTKLEKTLLNMKTISKENESLRAELAEAKRMQELLKLQQQMQEKTKECKDLKERLTKQTEDMQEMQRKLLKNDAKLYKMERARENFVEQMKCEREALTTETEKLKQDMKNIEAVKLKLEEELRQEKASVESLKRRLEAAASEEVTLEMLKKKLLSEIEVPESEAHLLQFIKDNTKFYAILQKDFQVSAEEALSKQAPQKPMSEQLSDEHDKTKISAHITDSLPQTKAFLLSNSEMENVKQAQLLELEAQLDETMDASKEERVKLLNQLLQQQNDKLSQLHETENQWEELLNSLKAAQAYEEQTQQQLALRNAELEQINQLFSEQNEEFRELQQLGLRIECAREQQQSEQLVKCVSETPEHQEKLHLLQQQLEQLTNERDNCADRLLNLEREMQQMKQRQREAVFMPMTIDVVGTYRANSSTDSESGVDKSQESFDSLDNSCAVTQHTIEDRLRILTKVLEAEHRRKMKRYDLHIRTLLTNVKNLKRALKAAERKAVIMGEEQAKTLEGLHDLQMTKRHLEEMRYKFELSQCTVRTLEKSLEMERQKFEASDLGKYAQQQEPDHEVANLIDDYKKLIQQSAAATQRPKTSAVLDLIQRSNQCLPNLNKLETTVEELRSDVQQFIANYTLRLGLGLAHNTLRVPSLMDELRAATEDF